MIRVRLAVTTCALLLLIFQSTRAQRQSDRASVLVAIHPLDPLTPDEIRRSAEISRSDSRLAKAVFRAVTTNEPPKAEVLAWQPGRTLARQARLHAMTTNTSYEVVVDLTGRRLVSVTEHPGAEPIIGASDFAASQVVLSNAEFKEGLAKRGITDMAKVFCAPFSAGYYGNPAHEGKGSCQSRLL